MLTFFDEIIERVLEHEGGYVDDPDDLGGETNYGITKRFYPDVDIKNLTKEEAKQIYYDDYWLKNKVDKMPSQLKHIYFDMCINMGKKTAVKILQGACIGKGKDIALDGGLGANTFKAVKDVEVERVRAYRVKYYVDIITRKPEQEKFYYGWFRRSLQV
tara:strand:- start:513 stop:989 length:477 start_codon:yes stop_codon:yes gene_type:complete